MRSETVGFPQDSSKPSDNSTLVQFDPPVLHLGGQPWFSEVPFTAKLRNGSKSEVLIKVINPGCGCTIMSGDYVGALIPAGDAIDISGTLLIEDRVGPHEKRVDFQLGSPDIIRSLVLSFEGLASFEWTPKEIAFQDVSLDDPLADGPTKSIVFRAPRQHVAGRPVADVPWLQCDYFQRSDAESEIFIQLRLEHTPHGYSFARIRVPTDDPNRGWFDVPIAVTAVASVRPDPGFLFLTAGETRSVSAIDVDGQRVEITQVECSDPTSLETRLMEDRRSVSVHCVKASDQTASLFLVSSSEHRARCLISTQNSKGELP